MYSSESDFAGEHDYYQHHDHDPVRLDLHGDLLRIFGTWYSGHSRGRIVLDATDRSSPRTVGPAGVGAVSWGG